MPASYVFAVAVAFILCAHILERLTGSRWPFVEFALLSLLVIVMGGSVDNPDYFTYARLFEEGGASGADPLYFALTNAARSAGLSYVGFRLLVSAASFALLYLAGRTLLEDRRVVYWLACYAVYPFMLDVVQTRNFLGMSLLTWGVSRVVKRGRRAVLQFALAISAAAAIQILFLIFVPLVIACWPSGRRILKSILLCMLPMSAIILFSPELLRDVRSSAVELLSPVDSRVDQYLSSDGGGYYIQLVAPLALLLLSLLGRHLVDRYGQSNLDETALRLLDFVFLVNLLIVVLAPLYLENSNFSRLYRDVLPLNYAGFLIVGRLVADTAPVARRLFAALWLGLLVYLFTRFNAEYGLTVVKPVLETNWFVRF